MKKILLILFTFFCLTNSHLSLADTHEQEKEAIVQKFKNAIKTDNPKIIANYISYPFARKHPLPDINTKDDFIKNYDIIFDNTLKELITNSTSKDWTSMGWRGIMLHNGILWINEDGNLIAINSKTEKELNYMKSWSENDKINLYPELRNFDDNLYIFETPHYTGRLDKIITDPESHQETYRLSLWNKGLSMDTKPTIVVENGSVEYQGSANNHEYTFMAGNTVYSFDVIYVGSKDSVPYALYISKNNKLVSAEEATLVK